MVSAVQGQQQAASALAARGHSARRKVSKYEGVAASCGDSPVSWHRALFQHLYPAVPSTHHTHHSRGGYVCKAPVPSCTQYPHTHHSARCAYIQFDSYSSALLCAGTPLCEDVGAVWERMLGCGRGWTKQHCWCKFCTRCVQLRISCVLLGACFVLVRETMNGTLWISADVGCASVQKRAAQRTLSWPP